MAKTKVELLILHRSHFCTRGLRKAVRLTTRPGGYLSRGEKNLPTALSVDPTSLSVEAANEEWTALAARDLAEPGQSGLRQFLRRFDSVFAERSAFGPLVQLSQCLTRLDRANAGFGELLERVCEEYANPDEGAGIKGIVVGTSLAALRVLSPNCRMRNHCSPSLL